MPHKTTEMRPDELILHRKLRTRITLIQPSLLTTVQKHHHQQKCAHDNTKALSVFDKGEQVLVRNHRGTPIWQKGQILRQKGPVTYLVRVGPKVRYCHVEHMIRRNPASQNNHTKTPVNQHSATDSPWVPDDEADIPLLPQQDAHMCDSSEITAQPRRSTQPVKPPQRLIEEL